ncbi:DUF1259 domain-containing protein [Polycladomyces subterraneus]|uniref:DUF1259 domain-containing protein n=1 Tax=Polycladomyces subterraneus TaxID=1016997 RepID=A0ABT8IKB6_9BACL|nr:DUF1259 domain-containing protein [Polycladomyces subterraneus]MDN4593238.1 DUF1259 domain-containing protein [Polycladomyces subterraneus]
MKKIFIILISCFLIVSLPMHLVYGNEKTGCKVLEQIFGTKAKAEKGVCKVEIPRNIPITFRGIKLSPETMELEFIATFEQTNGKTVVTGEFSLLESEVTPVLDTLRKGNLEISAIHNHWIYEKPRIIYLHFQGVGDMRNLAQTVKAAIQTTKS